MNYIGGKFLPAKGRPVSEVYSPLDGTILDRISLSGKKELDEAVTAAQATQPAWAELTYRQRSEVLYNYRNILLQRGEEIAELTHKENGKSLTEARAGVSKAQELVEFSCSLANSLQGRMQKVSRDIYCYEQRRPLGVVASITPFNFPVMVPHWTVPNAIAVGNAIILKPSDQTPLCAAKMGEMWKEAGLPDGIFNVVNGQKELVEALCDHPAIAAISFVGSTPIAQIVYKRASSHLKRVLALGGAKNHLILMPDTDPDIAVRDIIASAYGMAGQRCMATSTLITVGNCQHIVDKLVQKVSLMEPGKDLSPIISLQAIGKLEQYLNRAEGKILVDGRKKKARRPEEGYLFGPSIIEWKDDMPSEEVFGPVLEILRAQTLTEALHLQETSPYGNAASIFTQNGKAAATAINAFKEGMLGINVGIPVPRDPFSFGGTKSSKFGHGDITGYSSLDFWTDVVKITEKWNVEHKLDWMS